MADPYDDTDPYSSTSPGLAVIQQPAADPEKAQGYLRNYEERSNKAEASYEGIMKQRHDAIARVKGELDKTIQEMRDRQSGANGGINLPLLALGAGLLSPEPGGRVGNFGSELSRGLTAMGSTIANQRSQDADFLSRLAGLQMKGAELEDMPAKERAEYERQKAVAANSQVAGLQKALITSKADRPYALGNTGIIVNPKDGKMMNAFTNTEVDFNPKTADGRSALGSDLHGDDFLKTITDPTMRAAVKGFGDYDANLPSLPRTPAAGQYMTNLFAMAKQYNPDFDQKEYANIQKGMKDWTGSGKMAVQAGSAKTATGHLADLQSAAANLDNSVFQKFNNVANWLQSAKGDPRVNDFNTAKLAVVEELTKFLGGGKPAEGTMQDWQRQLNEASSPAQLQAVVSRIASLMHSQAKTMAENKSAAFRKKFTPDDIYESAAPVIKDIMNADISKSGGAMYAVRRDQNHKLELGGNPQLRQVPPAQWEAAIADLRKNPKLAPQFDEYFGPGSAKMVLGRH